MDYVYLGCVMIVEDKICLLNRQCIPNNRSGWGLKASIDQWLTSQNPLVPAQAHVVYTPLPPPPPLEQCAPPPARIKEVAETNILQIAQVMQVQTQKPVQCEDEDLDIFQVFVAEKKKRENKATKVLELANPPPPEQADTTTTHATRSAPQYRYQSSAEDQRLVSELHSLLMEGKLSLTTPAHVLAASPMIRKELVEKLRV